MLRAHRAGAVLLAGALAFTLSACSQDASEDVPPQPGDDPGAVQMPSPGTATGMPGADLLQLQNEYAGIQQRLGGLQQQAMADSSIQAELGAVQEAVEAAMMEMDPELPGNRARLTQLGAELRAAEEAGDTELAQKIMMEGNALQAGLQKAETDAIQQEAIAEKIAAFQEHMTERMTALDPEAPALIARANEIAEQLRGGR
jgi:hypothetical protein